VDEPVVEREPGLVHRAAPGRDDARPADREAIRVAAQVAEEGDVLAEAVVVIARDIARLAGRDRAGFAAERVPDRRPLAVRVVRTLDLVGGRRRAEEKTLRKAARERLRVVAAGHRPGSGSGHSTPMRALIPPFVAAYAVWPGRPAPPWIELTLTIEPPRRWRCGTACCAQKYAARTLTLKSSSYSASVSASGSRDFVTPELLTSTSRPPS